MNISIEYKLCEEPMFLKVNQVSNYTSIKKIDNRNLEFLVPLSPLHLPLVCWVKM